MKVLQKIAGIVRTNKRKTVAAALAILTLVGVTVDPEIVDAVVTIGTLVLSVL